MPPAVTAFRCVIDDGSDPDANAQLVTTQLCVRLLVAVVVLGRRLTPPTVFCSPPLSTTTVCLAFRRMVRVRLCMHTILVG